MFFLFLAADDHLEEVNFSYGLLLGAKGLLHEIVEVELILAGEAFFREGDLVGLGFDGLLDLLSEVLSKEAE